MKNKKLIIIALLSMIGIHSAIAQETSVYLKDTRGLVVKNSYGLCWRTQSWTPVAAANDPSVCECDPSEVAAIVCQKQFTPPPPPPQPQAQRLPAPPPPIKPQRISLAEDIAFEFGKHVLLPAGKAELDNLVNIYNNINANRLVISGNTDRIGTLKYNMNLGEQRAKAVRDYLTAKGLPFNNMDVTNAGPSNPITGKGCDNMGKENNKNKALIKCLTPDRRVDIFIYGIK